jgi:hypothetical protein
MLRDEKYFKKQRDKLLKQHPIKYMEHVATEMIKIAQHLSILPLL